ncbi:MAG TPA: glycosyl hydrolase family 8 [Solirubrobacteraceae bacterium]|nr:glycosyl hydrolase family 8 [Solirubrobacteraceae bacterium]
MRARLVALLLAPALLAGCGAGGDGGGTPAHDGSPAARFLTRYVERDGRVVRTDQGGDTVSEGQAYALLLTAATGERARFARVWGWTRTHLQRPDGLLASRWDGGRVVDRQPAADADLDAARALLVAAKRFHRPAYRAAALRIARGVIASETARIGGRLVLVAGPWARSRAIVDPSYFAPRTFELLAAAGGDARWTELEASSVAIVAALQGHRSGLAPDWARATGAGATPIGTPAQPAAQARHGYDAVRIAPRFAEACSPTARRQAAASWPALGPAVGAGRVAAVYDLGGTPLTQDEHPAALAGAAAAAAGAGDAKAARLLLRGAGALAARSPSYYGDAWAALAPILLRSRSLGGCPMLR